MDTHPDTRLRLEAPLTRLIDRLHKVEGDRRRECNPLDPDWEEMMTHAPSTHAKNAHDTFSLCG